MRAPLTLVVLSVLLGAARAAPPAPTLRVVVRIAAQEDEELLARLRGQTADMNVVLIAERLDAPAAPPGDPLAAAAALAQARGARVVVWVPHLPERVRVVHVAEPQAGRLLTRRIETAPPTDAAARSAAAEAEALVVRSALRAIQRGAHVGDPQPVAARPPAAPPSPPPQGPPRRSLLLWVQGGWQVALDGASPPGQHGLALRGGVRWGQLLVGVFGLGGLPARLVDELTEVTLSRHGVGLVLGYHRALSARWQVTAGGTAGALLLHRSTAALRPDVLPTSPRALPAFVAGPEVQLQLRLSQALGLHLALSAGADVVLPTAELGYLSEGGFASRDRLWPVQPRVGLSLGYERALR